MPLLSAANAHALSNTDRRAMLKYWRGQQMTNVLKYCLALCMGIAAMHSPATAAEPGAGDIRVLLLTGGHGFQKTPFFAMFDNMAGVNYTKAEMPADADLLKLGALFGPLGAQFQKSFAHPKGG